MVHVDNFFFSRISDAKIGGHLHQNNFMGEINEYSRAEKQ